jgi:hypothetical protein
MYRGLTRNWAVSLVGLYCVTAHYVVAWTSWYDCSILGNGSYNPCNAFRVGNYLAIAVFMASQMRIFFFSASITPKARACARAPLRAGHKAPACGPAQDWLQAVREVVEEGLADARGLQLGSGSVRASSSVHVMP